MLLLTSVSDIIRLVTGAAASTIEVHTSYMDVSGTTITPGRTNTRITTATTTIGCTISTSTMPSHSNEERTIMAIIGRPPFLRVGHQIKNVFFNGF